MSEHAHVVLLPNLGLKLECAFMIIHCGNKYNDFSFLFLGGPSDPYTVQE